MLCADFSGVQDLIPQLIDEPTALAYAAKVRRSLLEELFAVGTPAEVIDQLAEFRDNGMRHVVLGNAGAIQPSLRKSAATTVPFVRSPGVCEDSEKAYSNAITPRMFLPARRSFMASLMSSSLYFCVTSSSSLSFPASYIDSSIGIASRGFISP